MPIKKFSLCEILLFLLLAGYLCMQAFEVYVGNKQFCLISWIHSDKKYAKYLEINHYLLTDEQVAHFLLDPNQKIVQPIGKEIYSKRVNLVIQVKNKGRKIVWGSLGWNVHTTGWAKVDIMNLPNMSIQNYIIPIGTLITTSLENPIQSIQIRLSSLYTHIS